MSEGQEQEQEKEKIQMVNLRLPVPLYEKLRLLAFKKHRSMNQIASRAIKNHLRRFKD